MGRVVRSGDGLFHIDCPTPSLSVGSSKRRERERKSMIWGRGFMDLDS
jgi:hypothetical protein